MSSHHDVAVIGAGPYGLSAAAHLIGKGLDVAVFGKPLQLWRESMPEGMLLRSHWWATNLSDPENQYGFREFFAVSGYRGAYPVPIRMFIDYGMWFQKHAVPNLDQTLVASVERAPEGFVLGLADGREIFSTAVVMATGIRDYAHLPPEYSHLPPELVSHSFAHSNLKRFAGKTVAMVGGGQSAVEGSALLHEAGASVHLIPRRPIRWLLPDTDHQRTWIDQVRAPRAGIAPGWIPWALESFPYLFQRLPQPQKDWFIRTHYAAAANDWLRDRVLGKIRLHEGRRITGMDAARGGGVELTLSDGEQLKPDHVVLATGYRVGLRRLPMLSDRLRSQIRADEDVPLLNPWFETSVPGLFLLGLTSVRSFGPLYRFVAGVRAAATRVANRVQKQCRHE